MTIHSALRYLLLAGLCCLSISCANQSKTSTDTVQDNTPCIRKVDLRLIAAALKRDMNGMRAALDAGANVNAMAEGLGPAIVIVSVDVKAVRSVELLLDRGANINAADAEGYTPLINASLLGGQEMVRLLISRGADVASAVEIKPGHGGTSKVTPLLLAKTKGHVEIVKMLTEAGAKE